MSNATEFHKIPLVSRQIYIMNLPCFSVLTHKECEELASLMEEVRFNPEEEIVVEDDLVDSVYIVVSGRAEITRWGKNNRTTSIPIAMIGKGDSIGLNDTGFFSTTGKRTATITAYSPVDALKLDLTAFHAFLSRHPHLKIEMHEAAGEMLRLKLIKKSLPFSHLSHDRLRWLAERVEEKIVPAGQIIFRQGEPGDRCFLIRAGQVEIIGEGENGVEHKLAVLKSPTLFGEATLITKAPRNATARALEDCELLEISHDYLTELLVKESNLANMFMTLMIDRSRPLKNPRIIVHKRDATVEHNVVILKNPDNASYFNLAPEGWFIWQLLDGDHTMQEITMALAEQFNIFAPDIVVALISKLADAGFVENVTISKTEIMANQPFWARFVWRVRCILESRIAIGDADKWLTSFYNKFGRFLYSRTAIMLMGLLSLIGFFAFGCATEHVVNIFRTTPNSWILFLCVMFFSVVSITLHELGHALTTKAFGHEVHYMGVGWYWVRPVGFTDTSDMWLSTRWPRVAVNLAGVFVDVVFAALCTLLIFVFQNPYAQGFLWLMALYVYINAFRMLSPLQELDGYYVLMDGLDQPRLRQTSIMWLVKDFHKAIRHPSLFRQNMPEVLYWLACVGYLILLSLLTWFIQRFLFDILGWQSNLFISITLPIAVVIFSSLSVIAEIRHHTEK
jgi:CRP-like cAMP-binding protein/Zn-dependent protease